MLSSVWDLELNDPDWLLALMRDEILTVRHRMNVADNMDLLQSRALEVIGQH